MPSIEPALPGQLGDFVIVGVLGTGGSGVVLDARWGHREVALKVLHPTLIATARERAQFLEEARRLQEISHPGVVKVLASGELPDGRPYLAMEKLAGPTLAAKLATGALPLGRAVALFEQLAGAVQALHDRGLVHRDLKPENVVLVGDSHAVLLDFGIAKALAAPASTVTQDGGVRGTPAYMAPERFFGQPASVSTDVYELAVILYAMLAGRLPWADCGDPDVRLNPAPLDGVPEALDVEIRRALSTRAANRPASARDLAAEVAAAAGLPAGPISSRTTAQVPLDGARTPAWFERTSATGTSGVGTGPGTSGVGTGPNKGHTPLAWAPTAAQPAREPPAKKRRALWWALGGVGAIGFAVAIGYLATRKEDGAGGTPTQTAVVTGRTTANDPWAPHPGSADDPKDRGDDSRATATAANVPVVPLPRPVGELRAEMVAAVGKLPADTRTVLALGIAEMRADRDFAAILAAAVKRPEVSLIFGHTEDCKMGLSDVDWIVLGFAEPGVHLEGDAVMRGRYTHDQLESCLGSLASAKPRVDPATGIVHIDGTGIDYWIAYDGPVAAITSRPKATAAEVGAMVKRTEGPGGVTGAMLTTLDRDATIWFAMDADADATYEDVQIPPGVDIGAWGRIDNGLRGIIIGRMRDEADATKAQATLDAKIKEALDGGGDLMGKFEVGHQGKDVTLTGWLTPLTMSVAAQQISAME